MKMTSAQIEQTLHQLDAQAIPAEHPVLPQLERIYGDHTYFLDSNGLSIVEPFEAANNTARRGVVVNLARWIDADAESLEPHAPQSTELVIDLTDSRH